MAIVFNYGSGGSGINYSTNEQVIGTWINGKPIYQKTIDGGSCSSGEIKTIDGTITSANAQLLSYEGFGYHQSSGSWKTFPAVERAGTQYQAFIQLSNSGIQIVNGTSEGNRSNIYVTVRYIKTTD